MPKKKKSNRFDFLNDDDDEVPSIITAEDLANDDDEIGKKIGQQKKNKNKKDNKGEFSLLISLFLKSLLFLN